MRSRKLLRNGARIEGSMLVSSLIPSFSSLSFYLFVLIVNDTWTETGCVMSLSARVLVFQGMNLRVCEISWQFYCLC